jgi:hypothetical protein
MSNIKEVQVVRNNQTVTTPIGADAENVDISYNSSGVAVDSDDESVASTSDLKTFVNSTNTNLGGKAPTNHAANTTTYGGGTNANFGHVKLTDSYATVDQNAKAANSVGASAYALQEFYDEFKSSHLGHIIQDDTTTYTDRTNLKFENAKITDDATNDATIITPEYVEMTQAEYDALTPEEKNDGTPRFITDSGVAEPADVAIRKDAVSGNVSTTLTLADNNMTFASNKPVFKNINLDGYEILSKTGDNIGGYTLTEKFSHDIVKAHSSGSGSAQPSFEITIGNDDNFSEEGAVSGSTPVTIKGTDITFVNDNTYDEQSQLDVPNEITLPHKPGTVALKEELLDLIYPVGSIYITVGDINPSTTLGGTWTQFGAGKVLVGVDTSDTDFNTKSKTGGAKTSSYTPAGSNTAVTLTAAQSGVPAHAHTVNNNYVKTDAQSTGVTSNETFVFGSGSNRHGYCLTAFQSGNNKGQTYLNVPAHSTNGNTAANATQSHNHTFKGTAATISRVQPYITVAMWQRTA